MIRKSKNPFPDKMMAGIDGSDPEKRRPIFGQDQAPDKRLAGRYIVSTS
jgi:hypothetical protein